MQKIMQKYLPILLVNPIVLVGGPTVAYGSCGGGGSVLSSMAQRHVAFCEHYVALHERHVALHECHVALHVCHVAFLIFRQ